MFVLIYFVLAYFSGKNFRLNFNLVRLYESLFSVCAKTVSVSQITLTQATNLTEPYVPDAHDEPNELNGSPKLDGPCNLDKLNKRNILIYFKVILSRFLVYWPIDLVLGLYLSSTYNYFVHLLLVTISDLEPNVPNLALTNSVFILLLTFVARYVSSRRKASYVNVSSNSNLEFAEHSNGSFHTHIKSQKLFLAILLLQIISISWGAFLTQRSFHFSEGSLAAGTTVFSDLAPHTANIRNFAFGNIPSSYPHFAGAGMNYHFFFYYLCGVLNALGLRLDWALNIPSSLGILAFMQSLFYISLILSHRISAGFLSLFLFCFRSSLSGFFVFFVDLAQSNSLWQTLQNLWNSSSYSGPLLHDDWGLYNLNVYANQRHLLFVLSIAVWVLISFYPSIRNKDQLSWKEVMGLSLIGLTMAYWHGSVLIALNLILIVWALFSKVKTKLLCFGATNIIGAILMLKIFSRAEFSSSSMLQDIFHFGYLIDNPTFANIGNFLIILYGIALFIMILVPFLIEDKYLKLVSASFFVPIFFALTISLTPDVTVNHKFFIFTQILFIPFISHFVVRFWEYFGKQDFKKNSNIPNRTNFLNYLCKSLCVVGVVLMTFSGFVDFAVYKNASLNKVEVKTNDDFSQWIYQNTEPNSIVLTPPWHYHSYFITGRMSYFGWPYYSQSAGYDTSTRELEIRRILLAEINDYQKIVDYLHENKINYLMIDDFWRNNENTYINEKQLAEWFQEVAYFPKQENLKIYKIS